MRKSPSGPKTLYFTFAALMALLIATIGVSYVPLGMVNTAVALAIAVLKMLLVAAVFMNLRQSPGTVRLAAVAGLLWLSFAFVCVFADYRSRGWHEASGQIDQDLYSETDSR